MDKNLKNHQGLPDLLGEISGTYIGKNAYKNAYPPETSASYPQFDQMN